MHLVTFERRVESEHASDGRAGFERTSMGEASLGLEPLEGVRHGARRLGAVLQLGSHAGDVVDLNRALAVRLAWEEDAGAPEAEADSLLPAGVLGFLRKLPESLRAAQTALEFAIDALDRYDGPDLRRAGAVLARRSVRLCAPVPRPGKILAVARNYAGHAAERGASAARDQPLLFLKAPSAVIGPDDEIVLPGIATAVDYEGELAAVIGTRARCVEAAQALAHVAGYCAANDVTARDLQDERGHGFVAKSCDTFAPLGPALVTADEIPDPQDLSLCTVVSGETLQSARTKEMRFPVAELVAFASRLMTLEPGDVILTGTPAGVGKAQRPPRWLRDGDVVEVAIEKVGRLRNYVRSFTGS